MLHIAICDDDAVQLEKTKLETARCVDTTSTEIDLFSSGSALLEAIEKAAYMPDIAVLDIHMPGPNGIEIAKSINESCPRCRIIFLTSYLGYATEVYEARHSYFVLKSQIDQRLKDAFGRIFEDMDRDLLVSFRADGEQWKLWIEGVIYLERILRKVKIVCRRRSFTTTTRLEEIMKEIPEGKFIHCHQSYWVNPAYIRSMTADSFILADETVIPISRSCRTAAKDAFFFYLHNHHA